jgi:hypothetical protein
MFTLRCAWLAERIAQGAILPRVDEHRRRSRYVSVRTYQLQPNMSPEPVPRAAGLAKRAIRAAVSRRQTLPVADVKLVAAGAIPHTTGGELARRAGRAPYLSGQI